MNYLLFSGSLRAASFNKKLMLEANKILLSMGTQTNIADLKSLNIPVYDGDIEAQGLPDGVKQLGEMISKADALVIASPEYNGSIAGSLKNTIDWVSRLRPIPFENKPVLLMGTSPGHFGSIKALSVTRTPFETLGSFVFPSSFALPKAQDAFTATGELTDEGNKKRLTALLDTYHKFAQKMVRPL